jgi:hypothetical protein
MNMREYNLALTYAKAIIAKRPGAVYMSAKDKLEAARKRVDKSLLALARINIARKERVPKEPLQ